MRIDLVEKKNPYADKHNELTEGQQRRRQRLIRHSKRSKR